MARAPRKRLPPDERRALIETAASELFAQRGYAAARLDDIAATAGVTKPMIYRHFESKKALYLALLARHRDQFPRFVAPATPAAPLDSQLPAMLDMWLAYVEEHGYAWKMIFRDTTGDADIHAFRREVQTNAREVIAALVRSRPEAFALPAEEIEPLAEVLRSGMAGLALWWLERPDVPRAVLLDVLVRTFTGLLAAVRSPEAPKPAAGAG